jgi:hypothetical protein
MRAGAPQMNDLDNWTLRSRIAGDIAVFVGGTPHVSG